MRYLLVILVVLFSCKTTKRIESLSIRDSIDLKAEVRSEIFELRRTGSVAEVITETTTTRSVPHKKESGEEVIIQEQTTEKRTERITLNDETEKINSDVETETEQYETSVEDSFQRETEGQEVVKDITKGFTEGIFTSIFGSSFKIISGIVLLIFFVAFLFFVRKKSIKYENRE